MADKKPNAYMDSMILYQKAYDFLKYIYPILAQFPKFEKNALNGKANMGILEIMKNLI